LLALRHWQGRIDRKLAVAPQLNASKLVEDERIAAGFVSGLIARSPLPWLLVYDNVENPDIIEGLIPRSNTHLLVTSRWADWYSRATELTVDVFPKDVGLEYLLQRAKSKDRAGAARLADALGCLPLALDQAGAFCRHAGLSFDNYRKQLIEMMRIKPKGITYPNSIYGTFSLAVQKAVEEVQTAERILGILAFLSPDGVPLEFFHAAGDVENALAFETLTAVSLISIDQARGIVSVHRLVQQVMRDRVHQGGRYQDTKDEIVKCLGRGFALTPDTSFSSLATLNVLWFLHNDPDPNSSIDLEYCPDHNAYWWDVKFSKKNSNIIRKFEGGGDIESHGSSTQEYAYDNGWMMVETEGRIGLLHDPLQSEP
jgi:hypothetical protein